jgi:hypothetical protein
MSSCVLSDIDVEPISAYVRYQYQAGANRPVQIPERISRMGGV